MNSPEQNTLYIKNLCSLCNRDIKNDEYFTINDSFIKINRIYVPLSEIIRETVGFEEDLQTTDVSLLACKSCQERTSDFYKYKKRCRASQKEVQSRKINDDSETTTTKSEFSSSEEHLDDDKIVYSTVQIVKNYVKKYAVQEIREIESAMQLIIMPLHKQQQDELVSSSTNAFHDKNYSSSIIKQEPIENLVEIKIEPLEIKEEGEADAILGIDLDDFTSSHEESTNSSDNSLSKLPAFCNDRIFDGNRFVSKSELLLRKSKKDQLKKRERREDSWAATIQKKLRSTGQQYRSVKGYVVAAKCLGPPCNCRKNCSNKVNESNRLFNFKQYWKLESVNDKKKFILEHIKLVRPKRALTKARAFSRIMHHFLSVCNYDGSIEQIKVCKKMFCQTLNISNSVITNAFKAKDQYFEMDK